MKYQAYKAAKLLIDKNVTAEPIHDPLYILRKISTEFFVNFSENMSQK